MGFQFHSSIIIIVVICVLLMIINQNEFFQLSTSFEMFIFYLILLMLFRLYQNLSNKFKSIVYLIYSTNKNTISTKSQILDFRVIDVSEWIQLSQRERLKQLTHQYDFYFYFGIIEFIVCILFWGISWVFVSYVDNIFIIFNSIVGILLISFFFYDFFIYRLMMIFQFLLSSSSTCNTINV